MDTNTEKGIETFSFKPDIVEFNLQDDQFTAVTAADGMRKERANGEVIEFDTNFFEAVAPETSQKPVLINHDLGTVIGTVRNSVVNEDGNFVQIFDVEESEAADRIRNDAFEGFSIGVPRDSLVFADDGETVVGGDFHHLSVSFFPHKPVCGKEQCHVLFSENGLSRSCLCSEDTTKDDILGLRFDKSLYDVNDAVSWATDNDIMCPDDSERDATVRADNDNNALELFDPTLDDVPTTEDGISEINMGDGVIAYFDEDSGTQSPEETIDDGATLSDDDRSAIAQQIVDSIKEEQEIEDDDIMTDNNDQDDDSSGNDDEPRDEEPEEEPGEGVPEEEGGDSGEESPDDGGSEGIEDKLREKEKEIERLKDADKELQSVQEEKEKLEGHLKDNVIEDLPELDDNLRDIHGLDEDQNWRALDLDELQKEKQRIEVYGGITGNDDADGDDNDGGNDDRKPHEGDPPEPPEDPEDPEIEGAKNVYKKVAPYRSLSEDQ